VGRSSPVRSPELARVLGPDLAHALFPGELDRSGSLFSGKLVSGEGGGRRMQRGREGDERTSAGREMGGPRGGSSFAFWLLENEVFGSVTHLLCTP